ncbi:hypothetical protein [Coleofasciculus sp. F4-SAH-05]|uniref:hypothetical protein n=1 Tax=Coleofasciculus sp. F4-SAH-05 TaxID=3069525 RepID=UPI003303D13A
MTVADLRHVVVRRWYRRLKDSKSALAYFPQIQELPLLPLTTTLIQQVLIGLTLSFDSAKVSGSF